ncbi:tyrosine-type recombinase/integrase [Noviherbaspirillum massiliense]|uniref:tyrosine-type recombinase/integrase n=1 Tax=Noviherbaspirillum massiliense TaxID=1465823 RepID=UPI0002E12B07|nr:tyrosine-type recombinase/integrase [Noviherbaspirillum massiliense]
MAYEPLEPMERGVLEEKFSLTFTSWVEHRASSRSKNRSERGLTQKTVAVYQEMWNAFAMYCAERGLHLAEIRVGDLEDFLASRSEADNPRRTWGAARGKELSARYVRRFLTLIDRITRFEAGKQGIRANRAAYDLLQRPEYRYAEAAHKDPLPDYLSDAEVRQIIEHVTASSAVDGANAGMHWKEVRDRAAVAVMLGGGLAPGDVRALTLAGVLRVNPESDQGWKLSLPANGNGPARETPLSEWAARQLAAWLTIRQRQHIQGDFVFPSTAAGRAWSHSRCFEACKAVLENAGIPSAAGGLFRLRHTFALRHLAEGRPDDEVAKWLGLLDVSGMARYRRIVGVPIEID